MDELDRQLLDLCDAEAYAPDKIRALLAAGAYPDALEVTHGLVREPMLVRVIKRRNPDIDAALVRDFLEAGADPDIRGGHKQVTPLIAAASYGLADVCQVLLDAGADPDHVSEDIYNTTPLHVALIDRPAHLEAARVLLKAGADPNKIVRGETAACVAVENGTVEGLALLAEFGAEFGARPDHSAKDLLRDSPLALAMRTHGRIACARWLLEEAAVDVNEVDGSGNSALSMALRSESEEMLALAVEAGADLDLLVGRDESRQTALCLYLSWSRASFEMIAGLLEHGADANIADSSGRTPLWWAVNHARPKVVEALLRAGADPRGGGGGDGGGEVGSALELAMTRELDAIVALLEGHAPAHPRHDPLAFALALLDLQERVAFADVEIVRRGERYFKEAPGWYDRSGLTGAYVEEALGAYLLDDSSRGEALREVLNTHLEQAGQDVYAPGVAEITGLIAAASPEMSRRLQIEERAKDGARLLTAHLADGGDFFESNSGGMSTWGLLDEDRGVFNKTAGYEGEHREEYTWEEALARFEGYFSRWDESLKICSATSREIRLALKRQGAPTLRAWGLEHPRAR